MKKLTLSEELKRIHTLTYGTIVEDDYINKLINPINPDKKELEKPKVDDPKKADFVSGDVQDFFNSLQKGVDQGGLKQQSLGSMEYQKEVESMQIGLILLGYELPRYGVDGLFGPETGGAVRKFTEEKVTSKVNENITPVTGGGNNVIGGPGVGTHNADDWQSANAWDITGNVGNDVLSLTDGTVSKVYKSGGLKKVGGKVIYGDQVTVKSTNGPDVFYTHITAGVKQGDQVTVGSVMGVIMQGGGITPHVHIGLSSGSIKDFADVKGNVGGGKAVEVSNATPEMLSKEIELLKERGVTSEEIKKYTDLVSTGGSADFTDVDLTTDEGFKKYSTICDKFIQTRPPNPLGVTGDMMAEEAKRVFITHHKYVPPELALAQLAAEGGIGNGDMSSRPMKTKNPFNVGNTDNGDNINHDTVQDGIRSYYELIAKKYLGKGKTAKDLVQNFVNQSGNHYATAGVYEKVVNKIAMQVNKIAKTVA